MRNKWFDVILVMVIGSVAYAIIHDLNEFASRHLRISRDEQIAHHLGLAEGSAIADQVTKEAQ